MVRSFSPGLCCTVEGNFGVHVGKMKWVIIETRILRSNRSEFLVLVGQNVQVRIAVFLRLSSFDFN